MSTFLPVKTGLCAYVWAHVLPRCGCRFGLGALRQSAGCARGAAAQALCSPCLPAPGVLSGAAFLCLLGRLQCALCGFTQQQHKGSALARRRPLVCIVLKLATCWLCRSQGMQVVLTAAASACTPISTLHSSAHVCVSIASCVRTYCRQQVYGAALL